MSGDGNLGFRSLSVGWLLTSAVLQNGLVISACHIGGGHQTRRVRGQWRGEKANVVFFFLAALIRQIFDTPLNSDFKQQELGRFQSAF